MSVIDDAAIYRARDSGVLYSGRKGQDDMGPGQYVDQ